LGDRIASGGYSHTGGLLVGPIQADVYSIVWSLDGSKLSSGGISTRIFDSTTGTELHRFQHDHSLFSIALSPKYNLLAGVGQDGIVQLWDAESCQSLGQPFPLEDSESLHWVSFSPNGRYLAYGGCNEKITLRIVNDSAPDLPALAANHSDDLQQEAMPEFQSLSYHNVSILVFHSCHSNKTIAGRCYQSSGTASSK